jgi:beta-glucosidase/6-phospho-beta-glucosidase/beta-galactosidase
LSSSQQVLQDSYNGFVDARIVDDFVNFADTLFAAFGDRVKDWMTFNEPWITCALQVRWAVAAAAGSCQVHTCRWCVK